MRQAALDVLVLLALLSTASEARAGDPFEIQVYDGTANAPGVPGLELHLNDWATGNRVAVPPEAALHGQFHATLEPSLGVTPFWELGAYLQGAVRADDGVVDWAGVKLRSKFVTPPSWNNHWRLGMNFEVSYLPPTYDHDRWGSEIRPIVAWHDDGWLFVLNPILDQSLAGSDATQGPSFQPAVKVARTLGPVALGFEYYATLGPLSAILPWRQEEQQVFEVIDLVSVDRLEVNFGVGEGLTQDSAGIVVKAIVGYEFEGSDPRPPAAAANPFRGRF
ncbi:MAG: hypothetical protein ABSE49_25800 [Polyangiaceae bacterium]|jgi:hypothetical protein